MRRRISPWARQEILGVAPEGISIYNEIILLEKFVAYIEPAVLPDTLGNTDMSTTRIMVGFKRKA